MNAFIFDMDGTLLNTIHLWHEAEQRILDDAGLTLTKEQRDQLNAFTLEEAADFFHSKFGILGSAQEIVDAIVGSMLASYQTAASANPGAHEFVSAAHEAGVPMCVLSSSPQAFIEAGMESGGLKRFFPDDLLISVETLGMTKRDPQTYERICERLGAAPQATWFFDDSWYALKTARSCGLHTVGVFSADACGTHEELAQYSSRVIDAFTELNPADFI